MQTTHSHSCPKQKQKRKQKRHREGESEWKTRIKIVHKSIMDPLPMLRGGLGKPENVQCL